ncbi:unnamed protein product [Owenia fusiformis]|uniref:Uncharacterized protein n=1 Tax=Owenia fusiformis TaxID=6347 RepID=A0A8J1TC92_OWEFU|nr:unnamed protein product [Owenia fusiformis]
MFTTFRRAIMKPRRVAVVILLLGIATILILNFFRITRVPNEYQIREDRQKEYPITNKRPGDIQLERSEKTTDVRKTTARMERVVEKKVEIALVCLTCTLNIRKDIKDIPFFQNFMSSLCKTASTGYAYTIYLPKQEGTVDKVIKDILDSDFKSCSKKFDIQIRIIPDIDFKTNPGKGLNDIMYIAYLSGASYIYKMTDNANSSFSTNKWTEMYTSELGNRKYNNIGIIFDCKQETFRKCQCSYFIHKTHMDIFGSVFPPDIMGSDVDHWINYLYSENFTSYIPVTSVASCPERDIKGQDLITSLVIKYKPLLEHFISSLRTTQTKRKDWVISMSLWGNSHRYTYGAIRNAQLARVNFPEWTLRMYIEKRDILQNKHSKVPGDILTKLVELGVELYNVDTNRVTLGPMIWRFMVADDMTVDRFIVRDSDSRLTERDAATIHEWLQTDKPFHCIRDHPSHGNYPLNGGLFGGQPRDILKIFNEPWSKLSSRYGSNYLEDMNFLNRVVWPKAKNYFYCHDSVSCKKWPSSYPFPVARNGKEHVGGVYDQYNIPRQGDLDILNLDALPAECTKVTSTQAPETTIAPSTLKTSRPVVIWSNDFHISPIHDLKNFLQPMGVTFIDKSLSGHCHLTNTCANGLKVLDKGNGINLDRPSIYTEFFKAYKDDPEMEKVDAFVCYHPSSMCEIFMPFNKSIIVVPSTRYEMGRHSKERWEAWNVNLKRISDQPQNTIGANNQYDLEYVRYFTGITPTLLPSFCGYVEDKYNPTRPGFLLSPIHKAGFQNIFLGGFNKAKEELHSNVSLTPLRELYGHYKYSDLASHQGIVHVPYQVSVMSLFEQYRMNIPLFYPSLDLLASWQLTDNVLNERTWSSVFGSIPDKSVIPGVLDNVPDPNNDKNLEAIKYWLKFSDFYQWPHIVYFDSYKNLIEKLKSTDLRKVSDGMRKYNEKVKTDLTDRWQSILQKTRKFSKHYN